MKDHVKVSVIIPMYNRAHMIGRALESVFRQTLEGIEIIVIDDGSSDDSVEVVKEYQKTHPNLKLLLNEHSGPGYARNAGIRCAEGKYIAFLDSDDFIPERAYELLFSAAEEQEYDFVVGQVLRSIDTVNKGKWFVPQRISDTLKRYCGKNCAQCYDIPLVNPSIWNRLIRRDFILEYELFFSKELFGEDMVYNLKLFQCAKTATVIDEVVYCYETVYSGESSTVATMSLEPVLSGLRSVSSYVLFFDRLGRVDWEMEALLGPFEFVLQRFHKLSAEDKAVAFEEIKKYLRHYQGRREYEIPIRHLMGMDLDTLLILPYPAYDRSRELLSKQAGVYAPRPQVPVADPRMTVLQMFKNGKIGFRFILKYVKAWFKFKLRRG